MIKIAVLADNFREGQDFIETKFEGQIVAQNQMKQLWFVAKGEVQLELFVSTASKDIMKSADFDAFIISPFYESHEDVLKRRCHRGKRG